MRRAQRGGPGEFATRLARAEHLFETAGASRQPLGVLCSVLAYQHTRAADAGVEAAAAALARDAAARSASGRFPLVAIEPAIEVVLDETEAAVEALCGSLPMPLADAGRFLVALPRLERVEALATWIDDGLVVDPRVEFWLRVAATPVLELAAHDARTALAGGWHGAACPMCGGSPQVSVIAEESGEFMAGSPRSLVCGRCASWWSFPRVTCPACGEADPRHITSYLADGQQWARIDSCHTCQGYVKTFDLRERGGLDVVPLVDDVATLTLDVWARQEGYTRPALSFAGV